MDDIEKKSSQRRILMMVMASAFLTWQVPGMDFFAAVAAGERGLSGTVAAIGFVVWAGTLLWLLASGSRVSRNTTAATRSALEDELVRANRAKAFIIGYVVAVTSAAAVFLASLYLPVTGTDAAHLVMVLAVVAPMYAFAVLERINA